MSAHRLQKGTHEYESNFGVVVASQRRKVLPPNPGSAVRHPARFFHASDCKIPDNLLSICTSRLRRRRSDAGAKRVPSGIAIRLHPSACSAGRRRVSNQRNRTGAKHLHGFYLLRSTAPRPRPAHPCPCQSRYFAPPSSSQDRSRRLGCRSCTTRRPPCHRAAPAPPAD